ncbi:TetR/AcrR family transcriptional regulator [Stakelama tenebrarum]|uniref:TetR/AcrR family transcriptional regulator n=1 Tax=Stakelama tenebrarum TaxID=2711215 RepID=A0A6G6Y717_9SPHN|nr:TetR/AcrR family transcriptional regulator [Sphingosinithalassobacter tenebrarum]QIG80732.1 TetR/AcrR family transcriptional regulator [Sphingosinithalassobacter tenebrarum]
MTEAETATLRQRLVDEAVALLASGETAPSLRALARAAGVSAMAPYRHFADKDALMQAVAGRGFEMLGADLTAADEAGMAAGGSRAALIAQGHAYLAFARAHPALYRLMFADHCAAAQTPPASGRAFGVLGLRVTLLAPDNAQAATLACWAMVHGLAVMALDGVMDDVGESAEPVLALLADGIVGGERT